MLGIVIAADIQEINGAATIKGLEGLFENVIGALLGAGGIALFIMIMVAGFKIATSGDNPKAAEAARKTLTYAIIGMVLLASAYLILTLVSDFTGNENILLFQIRQ